MVLAMSSDLITIPLELTIKILSGLDAKCLMRCAMTCRYIYDVVENSPNLRLIIESHFTGFEVSGITSSTQSFPDNILRTFERCRRAWTSPRWYKSLSLHLENLNMIYFYRSGTLCGQEGNYTEITPLRADNPFSNIATGKTIKRTFQRQFTFREGHNWVDPSQDLLVLVSDNEVPVSFNETRIIRIHLRTLSTDDLHPRAMQPFLQLIVPPNEESNEIHGARVQIARNVLMIHFNTVPQPWNFDKKMRVVIWDWATSDLVLDSASSTISDPDEILRTVDSEVGILDSTHIFAVSSAGSGAIHLYKIVRPTPANPSTVQYHAKLHLPPVRSGVRIFMLYLQAGLLEGEADPRSASGEQLVVNDDDRIHALTIEYSHLISDYDLWDAPVNLYVHQRVFMQYFRPGGSTVDVPWDEWGPCNTKLVFPSCSQIEWSSYVHGQRVICPGPTSYDGTSYGITVNDEFDRLSILDFSLSSVISAQGMKIPFSTISDPLESLERGLSRKSGKMVPPMTILRSQLYLYEHDIETRLPCVSIDVDIDESYDTWKIDADGLVCIKRDYDKRCRIVDTYNA